MRKKNTGLENSLTENKILDSRFKTKEFRKLLTEKHRK